MMTEVTLKELLELRIEALEKAFKHYQKTAEEALKLQAQEYSRRLDSLNGEQERIARSQATYVSRELWDSFQIEHKSLMERLAINQASTITVKEFQVYKDYVDKSLATNTGHKEGVSMITYILVQILLSIAGIATVVGVILTNLK